MAQRPDPTPRQRHTPKTPRRIVVVGAGMAGVSCARTLAQAGHWVTLLDKSRGVGGRMSTRDTPFGGFDHGAQYFTVRDPRFQLALSTTNAPIARWQTNTVRVLDPLGQVLASTTPTADPLWVPAPGMKQLLKDWAQGLLAHPGCALLLDHQVTRLERDALHPKQWQLRAESGDGAVQVLGGFDQVVLAMPQPQSLALLRASGVAKSLQKAIGGVTTAPCWTLMVAYPLAVQAGSTPWGPYWSAARSSHHRISWLARETSKPNRGGVERWTVQASPAWSAEHLEDDAERVAGKLLKGFAEITGIRATPGHVVAHRWRYAQTQVPLGQPKLWDPVAGIGLCGDWCLGYRVEDAFVSGLELALTMV